MQFVLRHTDANSVETCSSQVLTQAAATCSEQCHLNDEAVIKFIMRCEVFPAVLLTPVGLIN